MSRIRLVVLLATLGGCAPAADDAARADSDYMAVPLGIGTGFGLDCIAEGAAAPQAFRLAFRTDAPDDIRLAATFADGASLVFSGRRESAGTFVELQAIDESASRAGEPVFLPAPEGAAAALVGSRLELDDRVLFAEGPAFTGQMNGAPQGRVILTDREGARGFHYCVMSSRAPVSPEHL